MSDQCPICGSYTFGSQFLGKPHRCPPAWWCWISDPDYDMERDDGMRIYNTHADDAATEYMERWDAEGDYVCIGGDEMQVSVAPVGDPDTVSVFKVRGEMIPEYEATPLSKDEGA